MRRFSLVVLLTVFCFSAFSQQEKAGKFGTEIYFSPFSGGDVFSLINGAKVRYFLSEKMAVRTTLNFATSPVTNFSYTGENNTDESKAKNTNTFFGINPGIELHFVSYEKVSLYGGAGLSLAMRRASYKETNSVNADMVEVKGDNGNGVRSSNRFGFNVFTGVDYYIVSNRLYIGAELGLQLSTGKNLEIVRTETIGGTATTTTNKDYAKSGGFGFYCEPSFRLGWNF